MSSWSKRRRTLYTIFFAVIIIGGILVPAYVILYEPPTCTDGVQNGNEQGVDCGGSCEMLCQSDFLPASSAWVRFEEVSPGFYNTAAYIINPNTTGQASNAPYHIALYDNRGVLISETQGSITLPPHRNTLAFIPAISTGKRVPSKALFEFTAAPQWIKKADPLSALTIGDKSYVEDQSGSSLIVVLKNPSVQAIMGVTVYAVLYDKEGNAVGFSKTLVDEIPARGSSLAPFTWPVDRKGAVSSIEILPVIE